MKVYKFTPRGAQWSYHWFSCVVASFRNLENENEKVNILIEELKTYEIDLSYRLESLEYFKDKFNFYFDINDLSNTTCEFIEYFGENLLADDKIHVDGYTYIRKNVLNKYENNKKFTNAYVYIRRNNQSKLHFNTMYSKRRNLIEEDELCDTLTKKYGFICIHLEDYNFNDKVDIFQNSKCIISPMGGALIFSIFASLSTKIIELYCSPGQTSGRNHFKNLCEDLKLNYERYSATVSFVDDHPIYKIDSSITINIEIFLNYLETLGINPIDKDSI